MCIFQKHTLYNIDNQDMETRKLLLIIDPQVDFISGTLPVPNAEEAMTALADYVANHQNTYQQIVATTDWHPYNHLSFKDNGGIWPTHCVQNAIGAALHPLLLVACNTNTAPFTVLRKGNDATKEEYSILANEHSAALLHNIITENSINEIHLCGLAGDICVLNTLKDLISKYDKKMFKVLTAYAPSLDDGTQLRQYLENEEITYE